MRYVVVTLLIATTAAGAQVPPVRAESLVIRDSVFAAEQRFFVAYDSLWKISQRTGNNFTVTDDALGNAGPRGYNLHCHPDDMMRDNGAFAQRRGIKSKHNWFAVCPSWDLSDMPSSGTDERLSIDTVLTDTNLVAARAHRAQLIALLDSAARAFPADSFLVGQRVRFLIDQRELNRALAAALQCRASRAWCSALVGYAHWARRDVVRADSAFTAALSAMSPDDRCRVTDHTELLDDDARGKYKDLSCARRDEINATIWWLADPLFSQPGNERRAEQHARIVMLALRAALERGERYSWDEKLGNDARERMILRYGWPSYASWGGPGQDTGHTRYLGMNAANQNSPYTSYEYLGARTHLIPGWSAIADPMRAKPADWDMNPPDPRERPKPPAVTAAPKPALYAPAAPKPPELRFWWPVEHFPSSQYIAQLPAGRYALLRRQHGALLAVATDLGSFRLGRRNGDVIEGLTLVASESPDSVKRTATGRGVVGSSFEIHGLVGSAPALAGIELAPSNPAHVAARLRFGISPPAPLAALAPGERAVSQPVILRAPDGNVVLPNEPDAALKLMASNDTVAGAKRIGVYWETYGFRPTDSVEVAIWIERFTSQGVARRFGVALRVATDLNTPVATSWKEPDPGHRSHVFAEGGVSIIGRSVVMDVSNLPAGDYWLDVAVRKIGQQDQPIRGRTSFVIAK